MTDYIYTIGHSNHTTEKFLRLLKDNDITAIADVRSSPYSSYAHWFNKEQLEDTLKENGISYVYLGTELGGRGSQPDHYTENGQVIYEELAKTKLFRSGLTRLSDGSRKYRIALMCSEKEPLACHRTLLIARELEHHGSNVIHILETGKRKRHHPETENELLENHDLDQEQLPFFGRSRTERLEIAYNRQAKRYAFKLTDINDKSN